MVLGVATRVAQWRAVTELKTLGVVDEAFGAKYDDIFNLPRVSGKWIEHAHVEVFQKKILLAAFL